MAEFTLQIDGMHCGSCIRRVEQALTSTRWNRSKGSEAGRGTAQCTRGPGAGRSRNCLSGQGRIHSSFGALNSSMETPQQNRSRCPSWA